MVADKISDRKQTLILSSNSFWNIRNFRSGLIESLSSNDWRVVVAAPDVDEDWIRRHGAASAPINVDRSGMNPFRDLALITSYHRLIRNYRANIFLGFTTKPNIYGSLAARIAGRTSLPNVSGLGTAFINGGLLSALVGMLYRLAFSTCPIVFFQNQDDLDLFVLRKIVRPGQARLIPGSGVDLGRFRPPKESSSGIRFLFVGRLLGDKGLREFFEAARMLRGDHPTWQFQLLGPIDEGNRSGIGRRELGRWIDDGSIEYLGQSDDVRPYVAAATAVVLPSYREGLSRSLLEAAAMARPLIATDVPGNRRIVEHGVNGLLCEARDHESLARAMDAVGQMDDRKRAAMGKAGREMVERSFDERLVIDAYLQAIGQLQAEGRG